MASASDIERYGNNPGLLVDLCSAVLDHLYSQSVSPGTHAREAQLSEIAKAIERMDKAGVAIPDGLRGEKNRLASELAIKSESLAALNCLVDELEKVLRDLMVRIGRDGNFTDGKKPRRKRSRSPKTDKQVLREHIIRALKKLGGRARLAAVIEEMGKQLEGRLLPGDLEWRDATNEYVWQNNTKWERYRMVQDGLLRSDSPHGYWELSEDNT